MKLYQPLLSRVQKIISGTLGRCKRNDGPKFPTGEERLSWTGPITVKIVLLARNSRTIFIQHPILSHWQAIKGYHLVRISDFLNFSGFSRFSPSSIFLLLVVSLFHSETTRLFWFEIILWCFGLEHFTTSEKCFSSICILTKKHILCCIDYSV